MDLKKTTKFTKTSLSLGTYWHSAIFINLVTHIYITFRFSFQVTAFEYTLPQSLGIDIGHLRIHIHIISRVLTLMQTTGNYPVKACITVDLSGVPKLQLFTSCNSKTSCQLSSIFWQASNIWCFQSGSFADAWGSEAVRWVQPGLPSWCIQMVDWRQAGVTKGCSTLNLCIVWLDGRMFLLTFFLRQPHKKTGLWYPTMGWIKSCPHITTHLFFTCLPSERCKTNKKNWKTTEQWHKVKTYSG